jgi:hypothetical protein
MYVAGVFGYMVLVFLALLFGSLVLRVGHALSLYWLICVAVLIAFYWSVVRKTNDGVPLTLGERVTASIGAVLAVPLCYLIVHSWKG